VHASEPVQVNRNIGAEHAGIRVWVEHVHDDLAPPVIRLELTEEGEVGDYQLPLHQAELLAQHMTALVVTAGGVG
jgi:hypothetical protein